VTYLCPDTGETASANRQLEVFEESGGNWATWANANYPADDRVDALGDPFRSNVRAFLLAVADSTDSATGRAPIPQIIQVYRPPERAYLLHWSWQIATQAGSPGEADQLCVPGGMHIIWQHYRTDGSLDGSGALDAARAMTNAFRLSTFPAYPTKHSERTAIDMFIEWHGTLTLTNASDSIVTVSGPSNSRQSQTFQNVGRTFGVIKGSSLNHWSDTGL
jgi:hypothetical protein